MSNNKSPYQLGQEAYGRGDDKNPFEQFSVKWGDWNRGYNSCWMPQWKQEQA